MHSLIIVSRLLDYPNSELWQSKHLLKSELKRCPELSTQQYNLIECFIDSYLTQPLLNKQAEYVAIFDYSKRASLHLLEHTLSESRDRGQAMVNLINDYRNDGFNISTHELPDYLPLILEYLSTKQKEDSKLLLNNINPILSILYQNLYNSDYANLFNVLLQLSGMSNLQINNLITEENKQIPITEDPLLQRVRLDKEWQEVEVRFNQPPECNQTSNIGKSKNSYTQYLNL